MVLTAVQIADIRGLWGGDVGRIVYLLKCLWFKKQGSIVCMLCRGCSLEDILSERTLCQSAPWAAEGLDSQREKN